MMFTCCCVDIYCMWTGLGGGGGTFFASKVTKVSLNGILLFCIGYWQYKKGLVHFYRCVFLIKDNAADLFLFP